MRPLFHEYKSTDESYIDPIITELWLNYREINLKYMINSIKLDKHMSLLDSHKRR